MRLPELPRISLGTLPTPLEDAPRLTEVLGGSRILIKRDDLTGFGLGGNKVRKLEYLLADAVAQDADIVVSGAGPQSNHLRTTAAAARRLGLDAVLVMHGEPPAEATGNYLLDQLAGAKIVFTGSEDRSLVDPMLDDVAADLRSRGRRPYVIPRGGASPLGTTGYVACALELESQLTAQGIRADHLVCATGSCGTQAGLWLGAAWLQTSYRIWGITVSRPRDECVARIQRLAQEAAQLLEVEAALPSEGPTVLDGFMGPGYGAVTPEGAEAIRLVARTEGVFLDPVYTGKALAGLIHLIRQGQFGPDETVIFLHTGGAPGLFAHGVELGSPYNKL